MADVGRGGGRVVSAIAALARLAMAAGIGCMVFAAAMAAILADGSPLASPELAVTTGLLGAMWTVGGIVVECLLRLASERPPEQAASTAPSWHNQHSGREARLPLRAAPRPQTAGWWTVLGVPVDASPAAVESAARTLLRQSHPDRWATADPVRRQEAEGRTRLILQALAEARASSR